VFGNIVGQMQHDLFHVYTVDEHTIFLVRNLRRFTVEKFSNEFPLCSKIIKKVPKQELLYLAGFFHDIAKGRGGDHSELGAIDAAEFCLLHGLSQYDTNIVAWLIRNHLIMSVTAQRKDTSDPAVIFDFAQRIGSQEKLDYLYLLTVADVRATSPSLWNAWKDSLLKELYFATTSAFRRGLENPLDISERIEQIKQAAKTLLEEQSVDAEATDKLWSNLEDDYFMRHNPDEIAWQTKAIVESDDANKHIILVREKTHRGGTELFVYTLDKKYIFALLTAGIERLGLTIIDARIITSNDGYALDTFIILENNGEVIKSKQRVLDIQKKLKSLLDHPTYENLQANQPNRAMSRHLKHFPIETEVTFRSDTRNLVTIMEVVSRDQPGLLARIAMALVNCKAQVLNAKIATFGERAEDIFYITDEENKPIDNVELLDKLRENVVELLDQ
jgi:[protein-PII] uridylyltransferase